MARPTEAHADVALRSPFPSHVHRRAAGLVHDFELKRSRKDLGDICQDIAEELRIGGATEIQLLREGDLVGSWDADRLAEAVSNLASNAVDYATPGTPVVIRAHGGGEGVVVEITNHGPSIPPEVLPVIFDAFRQGPASSSRCDCLAEGPGAATSSRRPPSAS